MIDIMQQLEAAIICVGHTLEPYDPDMGHYSRLCTQCGAQFYIGTTADSAHRLFPAHARCTNIHTGFTAAEWEHEHELQAWLIGQLRILQDSFK